MCMQIVEECGLLDTTVRVSALRLDVFGLFVGSKSFMTTSFKGERDKKHCSKVRGEKQSKAT